MHGSGFQLHMLGLLVSTFWTWTLRPGPFDYSGGLAQNTTQWGTSANKLAVARLIVYQFNSILEIHTKYNAGETYRDKFGPFKNPSSKRVWSHTPTTWIMNPPSSTRPHQHAYQWAHPDPWKSTKNFCLTDSWPHIHNEWMRMLQEKVAKGKDGW